MDAFFSGLSYLYPAAGKSSSTFRSTRGDVLQISGIQQSGYLDTEAEKNYLANAIMLQKKEKHKPQVTAGGTYIEIDITNQKLYYYENGVCRVATDIVTGNHRLRRDTPTGVFKVRAKQTNVNLVGKDYVSWRSKFGGSIYLTNGSHGCINVPPSVMKDLFPMVKRGTTVVVFQ